MESKGRWLFWSIFSIVAFSLVIGVFLYARSGQVPLEVLKNPIIVAVLAAAFLFLTLDRLKEMNGRIERIEGRVATFWQEVFKEIEDLASNQVKTELNALQEEAKSELKALNESISKVTSKNKWLQEVDPNDLALYSKHLEPIFVSAESLLRNGQRDIARKLINEALDDPEVKGTPNDYHNIGVLAAQSLNDDLLAMRVYEIYLEKVEQPNADVLADALQVCTRSENWQKAKEYAETIHEYLESDDPRFSKKWRPWVFLADYYFALGDTKTGISALENALGKVVGPEDKAHVLRSLADTYADIGNVEKATNLFTECYEKYPAHVPAGLQLGELYWRLGEIEKARTQFDSVLQQGNSNPSFIPHMAQVHANMAKLLLAQGEFDSAKQHAKTAIQLGADGRTVVELKPVLENTSSLQEVMHGVNLALMVASKVLKEDDFEHLKSEVRNQLADT